MSHAFDNAFQRLLSVEGGLSDITEDNGGLTKYGISQRSYPQVDIANLTEDQAKAIYQSDFWDALKLDQVLDSSVASAIFDTAVNFGQSRAKRIIQGIAGVTVDGIIGPKTLAAINSATAPIFIAMLVLSRIEHRVDVCLHDPSQKTFIIGWLRRDLDLLS